MIRRSRCLVLSLLCFGLFHVPSSAADFALTTAQWQSDLDFAIERIVTVHPHPFARSSEREFRAAAKTLRDELPSLTPEEAVVRMVSLVARLEDGHTSLQPYVGEAAAGGFETWFPIRFRRFAEGLFVTMAPAGRADLVGAEVIELGEVPAHEVWQRAQALVPAENEHWVAANTPLHLSSAEALVGLGILPAADKLPLRLRRLDGREESVVLEAVVAAQSPAWFWRWLRGPAGTDVVHGFAELPLHLALQEAGKPSYDFTYVDEARTLYVHLLGFWDDGEEGLLAFWERLWEFFDQHPVERLVFDLRVNGGGNGARVTPIVHGFIRRPELEEPGRLFVLTGGKTFSAAVMMADAMRLHTRATFVGTPMGAAYNHHGDAGTVSLPASGLELHVSTLYHQLSRSDDTRRAVSPQVPTPPAAAEYFAGRDPALEAIVGGDALRITDQFRTVGAARALATLEEWEERYASLRWWQPFAERELNSAAYELLRSGRLADAQAAFHLNAERFPDSGNVWDSLAESYLEARDLANARRYYAKSLEVDPGNGNASQKLESLASEDD